jgi:hypothetical protein
MLDRRTRSLDESENEPSFSDPATAARVAGIEHNGDAQPISGLAASDSETLDAAGPPVSLTHALRAARTPLIPGVDYRTRDPDGDARNAMQRAFDRSNNERPRVDTLSPLDSVPPPAPYPLEPPPPRPSIVPPVRLSYQDPPSGRADEYAPAAAIRSEPPPRIPISDRPSRPAYSSDPPPRCSHSEPPPPSSGRSSQDFRGLGSGDTAGQGVVSSRSRAALLREAVTIPADAHSPSHAQIDASKPLPPLRVPNLSGIRQHENSRLRNVAMAMMFVIFIVTGAIAGMRWYVSHDETATLPPAPTVPPREPANPRLKLGRLEANAVVAPRPAAPSDLASPEPETATASGTKTAKPNRQPVDERNVNRVDPTRVDPARVDSPWPGDVKAARPTTPAKKPRTAAERHPKSASKGTHPAADALIPLVPD